jgi:hypothetical protein
MSDLPRSMYAEIVAGLRVTKDIPIVLSGDALSRDVGSLVVEDFDEQAPDMSWSEFSSLGSIEPAYMMYDSGRIDFLRSRIRPVVIAEQLFARVNMVPSLFLSSEQDDVEGFLDVLWERTDLEAVIGRRDFESDVLSYIGYMRGDDTDFPRWVEDCFGYNDGMYAVMFDVLNADDAESIPFDENVDSEDMCAYSVEVGGRALNVFDATVND